MTSNYNLSQYFNATPRVGRSLVRGADGKAYVYDPATGQTTPFMLYREEEEGAGNDYQPDFNTPDLQRLFQLYENQYNQSITDTRNEYNNINQYQGDVQKRLAANNALAASQPQAAAAPPKPRYELVDTPDGKQIQDNQYGVRYSMNMAPQEALDAVGAGTTSTRPSDAATLPGQTAPATRGGVVKDNVYGNPTAGERAGGTVTTAYPLPPLPGGTPTPGSPSAGMGTVGAGIPGAYAIPRMQLPTSVDYNGSAGSIFGAYAGTSPTATYQPRYYAQPYAGNAGFYQQPAMQQGAPAGYNVPPPQVSYGYSEGAGGAGSPSGEGTYSLFAGETTPEMPQGGTKYSVMSAYGGPVSGGGMPQNEGGGEGDIPPDPGGGAVWNPQTGQWEMPGGTSAGGGTSGGTTGGTSGGTTGPSYPAPPGKKWAPKYGVDSRGNPTSTWELVDDASYIPQIPTPPQPPAQVGSRQEPIYNSTGQIVGWRSVNDPTYQQSPQAPVYNQTQIDEAMASIGLTNEQAARIKALLPGEMDLQHANIAQIYAGIQNAASQLGLQIDQQKFNQAYQTATLTGQLGDQATLARQQLFGFDQYGNPTLAALAQQHQNEMDYAASRRADTATNLSEAGVTGYYGGNPTLQREQNISSEERANLLAQAQIGNQAAQIRLAELAQAEGQREFDIQNEQAWRQNPTSLLDRAYNMRAAAPATTGYATPQYSTQTTAGAGGSGQQQQGYAAPAMASGTTGGGSSMGAGMQGPLTYADIQRAGGVSPGVDQALAGRGMGSYQTAGGIPQISAQSYGMMSPSERSIFNATLSATGNDPNDYFANRQRMRAAPVRSTSGYGAPRPVGASL